MRGSPSIWEEDFQSFSLFFFSSNQLDCQNLFVSMPHKINI